MTERLHVCSSRRHFLGTGAMGIGGLALAWLLNEEQAKAEPVKPDLERRAFDLKPKAPPAEPRAQAMISLFMGGGPSHLDLFDPKPVLHQLNGQAFPGTDVKYDNAGGATATVMASPWKFNRHGQCGMELSELIPNIAGIADEITLIRSMHLGGIRNHVAGMRALDTGRGTAGRPALGSWLTYALGAETRELPAFVAMQVGGLPPGSPFWSSAWLPSVYQGTLLRESEPRILNLDAPGSLAGPPQARQLAYLDALNRRHLESHPGELDLEARIASYELAARMQTAAKEALDISRETAATLSLYGIDEQATRKFGTSCLIARRLIERGVRFVQLWNYAWDMHEHIARVLPLRCQSVDKPTAGLIKDLKQRGLLDTTLVHWGGEMGRLPVVQYRGPGKEPGRDHNTDGFSMWLAGGGVKRGFVYGQTDEFGHKAAVDPVHHTDYHATLLHLFGLDAQALNFKRNGREHTLVDNQPCRVVREILA